ncbi:MAG: class I SAM-dependent methyltransferase [Planctomycetota bacterium]
MRPSVFPWEPFQSYELLDSGAGRKLERFGALVLDRPDPQALWRPRLDDWSQAHLVFVRESDRGGRFEARRRLPEGTTAEGWTVDVAPRGVSGVRALLRPTPFKHVGLFPEQAPNWARVAGSRSSFGGSAALLNLFGYTGVASICAARAGFAVTHVDASKASLDWCAENRRASGLDDDAVRMVHDDALVFARRELRRGNRYEVVLLDPPHFGRGPKGQRWQLEDDLVELLDVVRELLADRCLLVLSTYAVGHSPLAFLNLLATFEGGRADVGELAVPESGDGGRLLPCGFCARFERGLGT